MISILLIALVATAIHYLGYHAQITGWLWRRYRVGSWYEQLLKCSACSGTWIGAALGYPLSEGGYSLLGQNGGVAYYLLCACVGMVVTPISSFLMLFALQSVEHGEQEQP